MRLALPRRRFSRLTPSRPANSCASQRTAIVSGPDTLIGESASSRGAGAQRQRIGIALPDHVDMAHASHRSACRREPCRHIEQNAVAHVDRVVETKQPAGRAVAAARNVRTSVRARRTNWHIRRARAAARPLSHRRYRPGRTDRRSRSRTRRCANRENARRRSQARWTFIAQVSAGLSCAPNFRPAMKITLRTCGNASTAARSRKSQAIVLDPARVKRVSQRGFAESRDADDAFVRRGIPREPRQRRPHLAADAKHHDVAVDRRQVGGERPAGPSK